MIAIRAEQPVDPTGRTMFQVIKRDGATGEAIGYLEVVVRGSPKDYRCACTYFDSKRVPMITSTVAIVDPVPRAVTHAAVKR